MSLVIKRGRALDSRTGTVLAYELGAEIPSHEMMRINAKNLYELRGPYGIVAKIRASSDAVAKDYVRNEFVGLGTDLKLMRVSRTALKNPRRRSR